MPSVLGSQFRWGVVLSAVLAVGVLVGLWGIYLRPDGHEQAASQAMEAVPAPLELHPIAITVSEPRIPPIVPSAFPLPPETVFLNGFLAGGRASAVWEVDDSLASVVAFYAAARLPWWTRGPWTEAFGSATLSLTAVGSEIGDAEIRLTELGTYVRISLTIFLESSDRLGGVQESAALLSELLASPTAEPSRIIPSSLPKDLVPPDSAIVDASELPNGLVVAVWFRSGLPLEEAVSFYRDTILRSAGVDVDAASSTLGTVLTWSSGNEVGTVLVRDNTETQVTDIMILLER